MRRREQMPCQANVCLERTGWTRRNGGTGVETASRLRQAELVSASMAGPPTLRCAEGTGRLWTRKQVQGNEDGTCAVRWQPAGHGTVEGGAGKAGGRSVKCRSASLH